MILNNVNNAMLPEADARMLANMLAKMPKYKLFTPKTKEMFRSAMFSFTAESVRRAFSCEERIMYKGFSAYALF